MLKNSPIGRISPRVLVATGLTLLISATGVAPTHAGAPPDAARFRVTSVISAGACEGLPATEASIFPQTMTVGTHGEVAFVDNGAGTTVRAIDVSGRLRTLAWVPPASGESRFGNPAQLPGIPQLRSLASFPLAFEPSGRLLILDRDDHRLYAVEGGSLVPVVGTGTSGPVGAGDGGPPLAARLADPHAVATDDEGNIYLTDLDPVLGRSSIRYVNRSSEPRTFFPGTAGQLTVQPNTIQTIATEVPEALDGGLAAQYSAVGRVAPDDNGNIYFAVSYFNSTVVGSLFDSNLFQERVRVLNTTGVAHTLNGVEVPAGTTRTIAGTDANSNQVRDGVPARLYVVNPLFSEAVAVDDAGNVYLPMLGRAKIMKIDTAGIITTFLGEDPESSAYGKSTGSYAEIYGDGNYTPPGRDHSVTAVAGPRDVAIGPDGKSVYYVGMKEFAIRKVDAAGIVRPVAGNSFWRYCGDGSVAAPSDPLYGPKLANNTVAEGPRAVIDDAGNIYLADTANNAIRRVGPDGTISTIAGDPKPCSSGVGYTTTFPLVCPGGFSGDGGPPERAELSFPMSVALDDNGLFILDRGNAAVRYINLSDHVVRVLGVDVAAGTIETVVGPNPGVIDSDAIPQARARIGPACNMGMNYNFDAPLMDGRAARDAPICPSGMIPAPNGDLFVLDGFNRGALYRVDQENRLTQIAGRRPEDGYAVPSGGQEALDYDYCPISGPAKGTPLCLPYDLAVDGLGNVYVAHVNSTVLNASTSQGSMVSYINLGDQPVIAHGVTVAPDEIRRIAGRRGVTPTSCQPSQGDDGPAEDATFCSIGGIAFRDGQLFLSDSWNARVRVIDSDGIIRTFAGGPGATIGAGGAPDPFSGAFAGDGGLARNARFMLPAKPSSAASGGYLLVSDSGNYRVRMIVDCGDEDSSQTALCTAPLPLTKAVGDSPRAPGDFEPDRSWPYGPWHPSETWSLDAGAWTLWGPTTPG